jgi:hypothetical protein
MEPRPRLRFRVCGVARCEREQPLAINATIKPIFIQKIRDEMKVSTSAANSSTADDERYQPR